MQQSLDTRDREILNKRTATRESMEGPRIGDYVRFADGHLERFSHDWGDSLQTSEGGSFYLGNGWASFSGGLNKSQPKDKINQTQETKDGRFWFFKHDLWGAGRGIDVILTCRVFELQPEDGE